jgi:flagellar FliJ protein
MKRFHFPLRPVAIMRAHQELRAREVLAASIRATTQSAERLAAARARVAELESILFASRRRTLRAADEAAFFQAYRRECAAELEAQGRFLAARAEMERCREAYLEASRRVKTVERLEERARESYRLDYLRAEQSGIDEIAGRRSVQRGALT